MSDAIAVHHGAYGRCGLYSLNKPLPKHAHLESHLIFLLSGQTAQTKIDDEVYAFDTETVIAVNPLQPHTGEFGRGGVDNLVVVMYIKPEWFEQMAGEERQPVRFSRNSFSVTVEIKSLLSQVNGLIRESNTPSIHSALQTVIYRLTSECLQQSAGFDKTLAGESLQSSRDSRIEKSLRLIHHHLKDDVPPEHIASEVGLSRPHFYKLFREQVGVTPCVYQNTLKINAAIERLTNSDMPVNTIGHELGFSSPASFSRFFAANVGIPPVAYRRVASVETERAVAS